MKKLLVFIDLLLVLALSLLIASCGGGGGGGGGGGSDYSEPAAPVQNENSALSFEAPTYTAEDIGLTYVSGTYYTFKVNSEYSSYVWYLDSVKQGETSNEFTTSPSIGVHTIMAVVDDLYSGTIQFTVSESD